MHKLIRPYDISVNTLEKFPHEVLDFQKLPNLSVRKISYKVSRDFT